MSVGTNEHLVRQGMETSPQLGKQLLIYTPETYYLIINPHVCLWKETYSSLSRENANETLGTNGNWRDIFFLSNPPRSLWELVHILPRAISLHPSVDSHCHLSLSAHTLSSLRRMNTTPSCSQTIPPAPFPSSMAISLEILNCLFSHPDNV